jgi:hypothetical protein
MFYLRASVNFDGIATCLEGHKLEYNISKSPYVQFKINNLQNINKDTTLNNNMDNNNNKTLDFKIKNFKNTPVEFARISEVDIFGIGYIASLIKYSNLSFKIKALGIFIMLIIHYLIYFLIVYHLYWMFRLWGNGNIVISRLIEDKNQLDDKNFNINLSVLNFFYFSLWLFLQFALNLLPFFIYFYSYFDWNYFQLLLFFKFLKQNEKSHYCYYLRKSLIQDNELELNLEGFITIRQEISADKVNNLSSEFIETLDYYKKNLFYKTNDEEYSKNLESKYSALTLKNITDLESRKINKKIQHDSKFITHESYFVLDKIIRFRITTIKKNHEIINYIRMQVDRNFTIASVELKKIESKYYYIIEVVNIYDKTTEKYFLDENNIIRNQTNYNYNPYTYLVE